MTISHSPVMHTAVGKRNDDGLCIGRPNAVRGGGDPLRGNEAEELCACPYLGEAILWARGGGPVSGFRRSEIPWVPE